jgi:predicted dehydrogenase
LYMTNGVKIALAGISGYGDAYLSALLPKNGSNGSQLVGLVDPSPERCRRLDEVTAASVPIFSTMEALFERTPVDLMLIVTPTHLHARQTCFALEHQANVLCEKPVAGTVDDALQMLEVQRKSKGFAAIGYQWSFSDSVQALKRDIMSGILGRPIRMKSLALFPRSLSYFRRNDWAGRKHMSSGDGVFDSPVNNATAHYLHNMFYVLGKTRDGSAMPASVEAELYRANDIENYDTAAIRCKTDCGVEILFYTSHSVALREGPKSRYEFENAVVEHNHSASGEFIARFRDGRVVSYGQPNHDRHEKIWQSVEAVRTGAPVRCDIKSAMSHALCVAAAQESASAIVDFPEHLKRLVPLDGDSLICIEGLGDALLGAYERNILPSQMKDLFWARRARVVTVTPPDGSRRRESVAAVHA